MDKESNLLPWILGGLMIATVTVAIIVDSTGRIAPKNLQALSHTATQALPAILPTPNRTPAPVPAPVPTVTAAPIQPVSPPIVPGNGIWECRINGQRTFSDNPCGDHSSRREIGPINGMEPPLLRQARSYEPKSSYQPEYPYASEQEDFDPTEQEFANNSYPVFVAIPFQERRGPNHTPRPHGHSPRSDTNSIWAQPSGLQPPKMR
jgi:hypothetical protein